jgi:hypothetical protein
MHEGTLLFHEHAIKKLHGVIDFLHEMAHDCDFSRLEARSPIRGGGVDDRAKLNASPDRRSNWPGIMAEKRCCHRRRASHCCTAEIPAQMVCTCAQGKCENPETDCGKRNLGGWQHLRVLPRKKGRRIAPAAFRYSKENA